MKAVCHFNQSTHKKSGWMGRGKSSCEKMGDTAVKNGKEHEIAAKANGILNGIHNAGVKHGKGKTEV